MKKTNFLILLLTMLFGLGQASWAQEVVEISTVEQLKEFRDAVNAGNQYAGKTVKLIADLDLSSESNWKPIGNLVSYPGQSFNGTFDGDGHIISNLTVNDNTPNHAVAGLFGSVVSGTVKNLTIKNVNLKSTHYAGAIVAYTSNNPTVENCHVIGGTITSTPELINGKYDNGDKVGGIFGYATTGSTIKNCSVEGVTIRGYRDIGGVAGFTGGSVTDCSVKDIILIQDNTNGYKESDMSSTVGEVVGGRSANAVDVNKNNEKENVTIKRAGLGVAQIGDKLYKTLDEAVAAATEGQTILIIEAGDYKLPNLPKNVTIKGAADGIVSFTHTSGGSIASVPNGATFNNVTFNWGNVNYHGFQHAGTINMENCTLNGKLFSYGDMNFTDCKFVQDNSDYHMWAYSGNVTYKGCSFTNNETGKFINVYNEDGSIKYTVTVEDCTFININKEASNKAAINVKATCGATLLNYDVIIKSCTTEGSFPAASITQTLAVINNLVQVDDRTADGKDKITVTLDNKQVYPIKDYVAQVGDKKYESLQEAFNAAEDGQTVTLLKDYDASAENDGNYNNTKRNLWLSKGITLDGCGHELTVTNRGIGVQGADGKIDVIFKDIAIKNSKEEGRCIDTRGKIGSLTIDNAVLSTESKEASQPLTIGGDQKDTATVKILNGSKVITSDDGKYGYAITTFNPVNMTIDGSTIKGWACLNIKAASSSAGSNGSVFNITNSELTSKNVYSGSSNAYSVIKMEDVDVTVNVTNTTINVDGDSNTEAIVAFAPNNTNGSIVNLGEGNNVTFTGTTDFALNGNAVSKLVISGGKFNQPVPEENCAEGFIPADLGDGWYSVKKGSYVASIGDKKYESLQDAFYAAAGGETVKMLCDVELSDKMTVSLAGRSVVLDLDGKTLTGRTNLVSGNLTIKNGSVEFEGGQPLNVYGSPEAGASDYSVLTISEDVTVSGDYGVCMFGSEASKNGYGAVVNIAGTLKGKEGTVFVSGNLGTNVEGDMNNIVNITGTVEGNGNAGVALNGNATVNVKGGAKITGNTAVAIKRGCLNVGDGAEIHSNGEMNLHPEANNNGPEMTGAAISMTDTYNKYGGMSVTITGGTITSDNAPALFKKDAEYANAATIAVSGGIFSSAVLPEFCAEGYVPTEQLPDGRYSVVIAEDADIVLKDPTIEINETYSYTKDTEVKSITYLRKFDEEKHVGNYQAWYVPVDYTIKAEDLEKFDFFKIHMIAASANEEGGEVDNMNSIYIHIAKLKEGDVLKANKPYVIRPKQKGEFKFECGTTLKAMATGSRMHTETTEMEYDFYGAYSKLKPSKEHMLITLKNNGSLGWNGETSYVPTYRWYLIPTAKDGDDAYSKSGFYMIEDSEEVDGIDQNVRVEYQNVEGIYTLSGIKIDKLSKGVNIVRYTDGTTKKIFIK